MFDSHRTGIYVKLSINSVNAARFFRQRGTENFCICDDVSYVTEVSAELDASVFSYWYRLFQLNSVGAFPYCGRGRKRDKFLKVLIRFGRSDDGQTPQNSYRSLEKGCTVPGLQVNPATEFCRFIPDVCVFHVWNMLRVAQNFEVAPVFLEDSWAPDVKYTC